MSRTKRYWEDLTEKLQAFVEAYGGNLQPEFAETYSGVFFNDPPIPCNSMGIPLPHSGPNRRNYRCPRCMDTNLFNRVQYSTKDEVTCTAIVGKPGFSHECGYVGPIAHFRTDYRVQLDYLVQIPPSEEVAEPKLRDTDESLRKQRDDNLRSIFG